MNIKWLRTFVVAAQYENFRRAAEALFMAQPLSLFIFSSSKSR